jgi:hypothetical protein
MKHITRLGIVAQALVFAAATLGCEESDLDPMIGDFECDTFFFEGAATQCPSTSTITENGFTTETFDTVYMSMPADGLGTYTEFREVRIDGVIDTTQSYEDNFEIEGVKISDTDWEVYIPHLSGLVLVCNPTFSDVTCSGTDADGDLWEYNWLPIGGGDIL